jgi:hypothetical protein
LSHISQIQCENLHILFYSIHMLVQDIVALEIIHDKLLVKYIISK